MKLLKPRFDIPTKVLDLILKYYPEELLVYKIYFNHCVNVTELALLLADLNPKLKIDRDIIIRGGMLHDIGIVTTNAPDIGCFGDLPYLAHTYQGREILEKEGFADIAEICERHVGVGLSVQDIIEWKLPLPQRDMLPETMEEKLICYADKFYSKSNKHLFTAKPMDKVKIKIKKYGDDKYERFKILKKTFGTDFYKHLKKR